MFPFGFLFIMVHMCFLGCPYLVPTVMTGMIGIVLMTSSLLLKSWIALSTG